MVIIALLDLPLELPQDAPARCSGLTSFVDKLPEWLSKCRWHGRNRRGNGGDHGLTAG